VKTAPAGAACAENGFGCKGLDVLQRFGARRQLEVQEAKNRSAGLKGIIAAALSDTVDEHFETRRLAGEQLTEMAERVLASEISADEKRTKAHNGQRVAAGASAVVAGSSGGALAAGLGGLWAAVVGWTVIIAALASGVVGAVLPEAEYERNKRKARRYEKLWWDIRTYATLTLPTDEPASIAARLADFSAAIEAVGDV
jgi:hypothetical protein